MNSWVRHWAIVGLSSGDQRTIHSTKLTMEAGAVLNLSLSGIFTGLPSKFSKLNSAALSHFYITLKLQLKSGKEGPPALQATSGSANLQFWKGKEGFLCRFHRWDSLNSKRQSCDHKASSGRFQESDSTCFGCRWTPCYWRSKLIRNLWVWFPICPAPWKQRFQVWYRSGLCYSDYQGSYVMEKE